MALDAADWDVLDFAACCNNTDLCCWGSSEWPTAVPVGADTESSNHAGCLDSEIASGGSHCTSPPAAGNMLGTQAPAVAAAVGGTDPGPHAISRRLVSVAIAEIKRIADYTPCRLLVPKIFQWVGELSRLAPPDPLKAYDGLTAVWDSDSAVIQRILEEVDYMRNLGGSGFDVLGCLCSARGALRAALQR